MMASRAFPVVQNGEWVQPQRKGYKMQCCDCGSVHTMDFRVHKGHIQFRAVGNYRSTALVRRHRDLMDYAPELTEMILRASRALAIDATKEKTTHE